MRKRRPQPEKIIMPGEYEPGVEAIVQIYFRIFDKNQGGSLPPAIIAKADPMGFYQGMARKKYEELVYRHGRLYPPATEVIHSTERIIEVLTAASGELSGEANFGAYRALGELKRAKEKCERLVQLAGIDSYVLIDGNHKVIAATLTHRPIHALQLENDADIQTIRLMVARGELFNFPHEHNTLPEIIEDFMDCCMGSIGRTTTVRQGVDRLVSEEKLPDYMVGTYQNTNKAGQRTGK